MSFVGTISPSLKLFAPGDMELLGSVTNLHTLRVNEGQDGGLLFPLQAFSAHSRILKLLAAPTYIYIWFVEVTMEKLEQIKFYCCDGSSLKVSGLVHLLPSPKSGLRPPVTTQSGK
jgi:hypothetical protein